MATVDLTAELLAVIEKNLPAATVGVLQKRLNEATALERKIETLETAAKSSLAREQQAEATIRELRATVERLDGQLNTFLGREIAIADAERKILIADMNTMKANAVVEAQTNMLGIIFRVPEVRRTVHTSVNPTSTGLGASGANGSYTPAFGESRFEDVKESVQ